MLEPYHGFLGPDNRSASYMADAERLVNLYAQPVESASAPAKWVLIPTPGFRLLASVSQSPGRANFSENRRNFFIAGFAFYEYFEDGSAPVLRGAVSADGNPATITGNGDAGNQLFITSGNLGYCYNLTTNTLTQVLTGATMGAFLDGFFLALDAGTSTLKVSNLLNGQIWNPLNIAQRTAGSDRWQALYVVNRLMYLQGSATSEVWNNQNVAVGQPFAPIQEGFSQHGTAAPFSGAVDSSLTFLGRNANGRGIVYRMQGYTPQRVSTHAIEVAIQGYSTITDAVAGITQQQGRAVYELTFPTADKTHALDEGTGLWHQREYWDSATATAKASRAMFFAALPTLSVCCDRLTGSLYVIDPAVYTDMGGAPLQRIREAPRLSANGYRFIVNDFQLICDVGVGLPTGQGSDPQAMLQISKDGGQTWGPEQWTTLGQIGAYDTRVRWPRLGQARNFVPRVVVSDPVPFRITNALVDVTVGRS